MPRTTQSHVFFSSATRNESAIAPQKYSSLGTMPPALKLAATSTKAEGQQSPRRADAPPSLRRSATPPKKKAAKKNKKNAEKPLGALAEEADDGACPWPESACGVSRKLLPGGWAYYPELGLHNGDAETISTSRMSVAAAKDYAISQGYIGFEYGSDGTIYFKNEFTSFGKWPGISTPWAPDPPLTAPSDLARSGSRHARRPRRHVPQVGGRRH